MKTIINPNLRCSVLKKWRGARAKIWMFNITHNRLALRLSNVDMPEVLYIVATGCEHIIGSFSWDFADILIVVEPPNEWGEIRCRVSDSRADFELLCSDVTLVSGSIEEMDQSFENFLGTQ